MKRFIALALFIWAVNSPAAAAEAKDARVTEHKGVGLMFQAVDPNKKFDTGFIPAEQGIRNIAKAIDQLLKRSPISARKIKALKESGRVILLYTPDDLRNNAAGSEAVALFLPDFLRKSDKREQRKTFLVVVGRHGVKWPADELAAVLAHELVGHGVQHQRGRLSDIRDLDAECEAYMYEEIAIQDLGLDKDTREMVAFRKAMEGHFCSDFKTYMRKSRSRDMALWDVLNPDIPKLLQIFEGYLAQSKRKGITGKSLAAKKQLLQERRKRGFKDASPDEIYKFATQLRDGDFGVSPDLSEAFRYFKLAGERGHAGAQFDLGWIYTKGDGVQKDLAKAFTWFQKAAEQGRAAAQSRLGWLYMRGNGTAKDYAAAHQWFTKAAKQKYTLAYYNLGAMHRLGLGRNKNHAVAAEWYRKGAEAGHAGSQYRYGWYYYRGIGVAKDHREAAVWFKRSANNNYVYAQNRLGWMYTQGKGVKKDPAQALAWFRTAAEKGFPASQSRLGWLHMKGKGVAKDYDAAYQWFTKAAAKKYALASYNLGTMHKLGLGRAKDPTGAAEWYRKGAERGHAASQNQIGWIVANGTGVPKDKIEAYKWYTLAAAKGNKTARNNLTALTKTMSPADISKAKRRVQEYAAK
ncbi:MAG: sel1 repeat family protein [Rhodospirillaceae bacterium]|jgi:TPR repeat protein|nr:sel1 repeat family protein [Rhodospirillaceae bacterium]MBT5811676.1 sel1 repeat family protein [Rhodospirillaceae bacterium]